MDPENELFGVSTNLQKHRVSADHSQVPPESARRNDPSIRSNLSRKPPDDVAVIIAKSEKLVGGATKGFPRKVSKRSLERPTGSKFSLSDKEPSLIEMKSSLDLKASLGPSPKVSVMKPVSRSKRRTSKLTKPAALPAASPTERESRDSRKCLGDCVPFGVIFAISLLAAAGHMLTEQVRQAEALNPGLGYMFKLVDRDDWCGHFEHDYQPPAIHGYYSLMTNLTALVGAERHFSSRGNVEISFYPEIVGFDATEGEDAVFILCFTIPVMMMVVEANSSTMWVKTLRQPCASTPVFYDYLDDEIRRPVTDGVSFEDVIVKGYPLRFAIIVDVMKSEASFKVCKLLDSDCVDTVGSISQPLKYASLEKGVKKFALVSKGFASRLKFYCRISESKLPLCWAPGSTVPRLCPI